MKTLRRQPRRTVCCRCCDADVTSHQLRCQRPSTAAKRQTHSQLSAQPRQASSRHTSKPQGQLLRSPGGSQVRVQLLTLMRRTPESPLAPPSAGPAASASPAARGKNTTGARNDAHSRSEHSWHSAGSPAGQMPGFKLHDAHAVAVLLACSKQITGKLIQRN